MLNKQIHRGEWVTVTARRSKYYGLEGEVQSLTESQKSARVHLGERSVTLRITSLTRSERPLGKVEEALLDVVEELTAVLRLVRRQLEEKT